MDYGYVLRRGWQVAWRHKALWLFAFLAGMVQVSLSFQQSAYLLPERWREGLESFAQGPYFVPVAVSVVGLTLILVVALAWLRALGEAALVDQVAALESWGTLPSVRAGWRQGRRFAWRVLLVTLLISVPILLVIVPATLVGLTPLVRGRPAPENIVPLLACLTLAVCLGAPLVIGLTLLRTLAVRACVLEDLGVWRSVVRAWDLVLSKPGQVLLFWLTMTGIGIGVGAAAAALLCPLFGLFVPLSRGLGGGPAIRSPFLCLMGLFALIAALAGVIWGTFDSACWTLAYRHLAALGRTGEEVAPRA